jgi:hypothetical protein
MKILNLILTIVILSSLITIINADERKRVSNKNKNILYDLYLLRVHQIYTENDFVIY